MVGAEVAASSAGCGGRLRDSQVKALSCVFLSVFFTVLIKRAPLTGNWFCLYRLTHNALQPAAVCGRPLLLSRCVYLGSSVERERVSGAERGDVTGWTDQWREHVRSMDGASVAVQAGRRGAARASYAVCTALEMSLCYAW